MSVHSPGQQVFVQDLVRRHTDQPVWIGGYDAAQVHWVNNSSVSLSVCQPVCQMSTVYRGKRSTYFLFKNNEVVSIHQSMCFCDKEGMWLWSDGSAVDSFYWEEDEPSNSGQGENCMELHTGGTHKHTHTHTHTLSEHIEITEVRFVLTTGGQGWNDVSCAELRFYVCSMETR